MLQTEFLVDFSRRYSVNLVMLATQLTETESERNSKATEEGHPTMFVDHT